MARGRGIMDRRSFLLYGASFLTGSLFGFSSFSKALASEECKKKIFFQPRIALIIDDIGYSRARARLFLDLGVPMTFAILPRLPNTQKLAMEIRKRGQEIMLHQPMEPFDSDLNPGPGALYVGYEAKRIGRIMEENISEVPFALGVNNHMGSRFTSCQKEMNQALSVIKKRGLFFVDSLTSGRSKAYKTAKKLHMTAGCRNIFLDNRPYESYILSQLQRLKKHALNYGYAIGIGHPFNETSRAIRHFLGDLKDSGISFVHVSQLLSA